jgi:hypothetical protein
MGRAFSNHEKTRSSHEEAFMEHEGRSLSAEETFSKHEEPLFEG